MGDYSLSRTSWNAGGVVAFIEDIHRSIPDLDEQVYNFIEERLRNHDTGTFNIAN